MLAEEMERYVDGIQCEAWADQQPAWVVDCAVSTSREGAGRWEGRSNDNGRRG